MASLFRIFFWGGLLLLIPFLADGRWPWLQDAWGALLIGGLLFELLTASSDQRKRSQEREEARRKRAETTRRRNEELAAEKAAQAAQEERERIRLALDSLKSLVEAHAEELVARRKELVKYGRYAIPDFSDWIAEKEFFADEVVARKDPSVKATLTRAQVLNSIDAVLDGRPMDQVVLDSTGTASSQSLPSESADELGIRACPVCGENVSASQRTCPKCGASFDPPRAADTSDGQDKEQAPTDPSKASEQPGGGDRYDRITGRLCTISLVLAIPGIFLPGLGIFQVSALVVGIVALRRNNSRQLTGRWQAWVGTVLGAIYTVYFIVRFAQGYFGLY